LAFNLFRDARTAEADRRVEAYLVERFPGTGASVMEVRGALFHGYAGSALLRFADAAAAREGAAALLRAPGIEVSPETGGASPAVAVEEAGMRIDPPVVHEESVTVWFAFDGLTLAARAALDAVRALLGA